MTDMGIEFINDKIDNLGLSRGLTNSLIAYGSIDTISALTSFISQANTISYDFLPSKFMVSSRHNGTG